MSNQEKAAQGSAATASKKKQYKNMTQSEKTAHLGKVFLFLLTFGFAYPTVLLD